MGRPTVWTETDVIGRRFGRLTGIGRSRRPYHWRCKCDCGRDVDVASGALRSGNTRSCGCLKAQTASARSYVHGHAAGGTLTSEYQSWRGMRNRCLNPRSEDYDDYGGRGIEICERWLSFANFFADMGPKPTSKHSIDRWPDVNGNYEPGNCRWATAVEQANNKRASKQRRAA